MGHVFFQQQFRPNNHGTKTNQAAEISLYIQKL